MAHLVHAWSFMTDRERRVTRRGLASAIATANMGQAALGVSLSVRDEARIQCGERAANGFYVRCPFRRGGKDGLAE